MSQETTLRIPTCPWTSMFLCLALALLNSLSVDASEPAVAGDFHPGRHGSLIYFPLGQLSFADQVVSYSTGDEEPHEIHRVASRSIGAPATARQGSFNWGRIELDLGPASATFEALGYNCDETEPGDSWTGQKTAP